MFLPWAREPPPTIEIFAPKLSARIKIALLVSYSNVSEIVSPPFIRSRSQSSVIIFPKTGSWVIFPKTGFLVLLLCYCCILLYKIY